MTKLTIRLLDTNRNLAHELELIDDEIEQVAEASCIVYDEKHYIYSGSEGKFLSTVVFMECKPPVRLAKRKRTRGGT